MASDGVPESRGGRPAPLRVAVLVLAGLAAIATVAAVWYGISWARAENDSDLELAQTRDTVLREAGQAAVNLNTLDHERVEQALELWERSSTGQVLENFRSNRQQYADYIEQSGRRTTGTVVDGAVAELDTDKGTARVLMVLEIISEPEGADPVSSRQRLDMQLERTAQGWKVSSVGPVGTTTAPGTPPATPPPAPAASSPPSSTSAGPAPPPATTGAPR